MKILVTFGQVRSHELNGVVFDKDCVASIEARDFDHGLQLAHALFKGLYCFTYLKINNMSYFVRGIIEVDSLSIELAELKL